MASFRKRTGGWEYRISVKEVDVKGKVKYRTVSKGGYRTKKEAEIAATRRYETLAEDRGVKGQSIGQFVSEWYEENIEQKKDDYALNTRKTYSQVIKNHIVPKIGHVQVKELTPKRYQRFINELLEEFSAGTVRRIHTPIALAFKQAVINGYLISSPVQYVKIGKRERKKLKYLETKYVQEVLEFLYRRNYDQAIFFECLFESGMRKGECTALQLNDIDWTNNTIRVDETYNYQARGDEKRLDVVKTESSERTIVMRLSFMQKLKTYVKYRIEKRSLVGSLYDTEHNFVFGRADGTPWPNSTIDNSFKAALKSIEYDSLPIHSTRHTHAVMMLEAGATMKEVQERLGHSSMQVTADIYSHVTNKMKTRSIELFDEYMKKNV